MTGPLTSNSQQTHTPSVAIATSNQRAPLNEININIVQVANDNKVKATKTLADYAWSLVDDLLKLHKDANNIAEASKKLKEEVEKGIALFEAYAKKQNKDPVVFSATFAKNVFALSSMLFDK